MLISTVELNQVEKPWSLRNHSQLDKEALLLIISNFPMEVLMYGNMMHEPLQEDLQIII